METADHWGGADVARLSARVDALVADVVQGRPGVLVLSGVGAGKTSWLESAFARLGGQWTVLSCRAAPTETDVPFAGLDQLLRPLREDIAQLPSLQAEVLLGALGLGPASGGGRLGVGTATLELLARRSQTGPLIVTIDDAQWLDVSSAQVVDFVARRLHAEGICVIIATDKQPQPGGVFDGLPHMAIASSSAQTEAAPIELDAVDTLLVLLVAVGHDLPVDVLVDAGARCNIPAGRLTAAEERGLVILRSGRVHLASHAFTARVLEMATPAQTRAAHQALAAAYGGWRSHPDGPALRHAVAGTEGPDDELSKCLEKTAVRAAARRGFTEAVDLMNQAADLSAVVSTRDRLRLQAAELGIAAGRLADARAALDDIDVHGVLRQQAAHLRARLALWSGQPRAAIHELVELAATDHSHLASILWAEASLAALMVADQRQGRILAERAVDVAHDEESGAPARIMLAFALANVNEVAQARSLVTSALPFLAARATEQWPVVAATALFLAGQLDEAARLLSSATDVARRVAVAETLSTPLGVLALLEIQRGHWQRARLLAEEGLNAADLVSNDRGDGLRRSTCLAALAGLSAITDDAPGCRVFAGQLLSAADIAAEPVAEFQAHRALGMLSLGSGDALEAAERLGRVRDFCQDVGFAETPFLPYLADLIEARVAAGVGDVAGPLDELTVTAEKTGLDRDIGLTLRSRALLLGDVDSQVAAALEASAFLRRAGIPFEAARADLLAGELLRRARQRGRAAEALTRACVTFERLRATRWSHRASGELRLTGLAKDLSSTNVHHTLPVLTAQETQVASLAAAGLSNQEIAGRLFLSTKTVEYHLGNLYRKIGINRRSQLAQLPGFRWSSDQ